MTPVNFNVPHHPHSAASTLPVPQIASAVPHALPLGRPPFHLPHPHLQPVLQPLPLFPPSSTTTNIDHINTHTNTPTATTAPCSQSQSPASSRPSTSTSSSSRLPAAVNAVAKLQTTINNENDSKPEHISEGDKNIKTNAENGGDNPLFLEPPTSQDQQQQRQGQQHDCRPPFKRSLCPSPSSDDVQQPSSTPSTNEIEKDAKPDDHMTPASSHSQSLMGTQSQLFKPSPLVSNCHPTAATVTPSCRVTPIVPPLSHVPPTVNGTQRNDAPLPRPQALPPTHIVNGNGNSNSICERPSTSTPVLPQPPSPLPPAPTLSRSYDLKQLSSAGFTFVDGHVLNEKGQVICGVLNQHNQPCRRIGKCPFHLFMQRHHRNHDRQPHLEHHRRGGDTVDSAASPASHPTATVDGIVQDDGLGKTGASPSTAGVEKPGRESDDRNNSFDCVSSSSIRSGVRGSGAACEGAGRGVGTSAGHRSSQLLFPAPIDGGLSTKPSVYHMHNNKSGMSTAPGSGEVIGPPLPSFTAAVPPQPSSLHGTRGRMRYRNGWSKEEHFKFLCGLRKYSRGCWKMIAQYVGTRTATQVQSHAQKYYLRRTQTGKKKCSIHDLTLDSPEMLLIEKDLRSRGELDSSSCSSGGRGRGCSHGGNNGIEHNNSMKRTIVNNGSEGQCNDNVGDDDSEDGDDIISPDKGGVEERLQRNGQGATESTAVGSAVQYGGDFPSRRLWDSRPAGMVGNPPYSNSPPPASGVFSDRFVNYNIGMGSTARPVGPLDQSHPVLPLMRPGASAPAGLLGDAAAPNGSGDLLDGGGSSGGMRMTMDVGGISANTALGLEPPACTMPLCMPPTVADTSDTRQQQGKLNSDRDVNNIDGIGRTASHDIGRTEDDDGMIQFGDNALPPVLQQVVEQQHGAHASAAQHLLHTENHDLYPLQHQQHHHQLPHHSQGKEHHVNYFQQHHTHPANAHHVGLTATTAAMSTATAGTHFQALPATHHGLQQADNTPQHYQLSALQQQAETVNTALPQLLTSDELQNHHHHSVNEHVVNNISTNHQHYAVISHHQQQLQQQQQPLDVTPLNSVHECHEMHYDGQQLLRYPVPCPNGVMGHGSKPGSRVLNDDAPPVTPTLASAVEGVRLGGTLGKHDRSGDSVGVSAVKRARRAWNGFGMSEEVSASNTGAIYS